MHSTENQRCSLAGLWYEVGLLERLLYKNKNQHRHTLHFQRLQQVHRILMIVRKSSGATAALEQLLEKTSAAAELRERPLISGPFDVPNGGAGLLLLLQQLLSAIEAASKALGALLAQSFFMPFALTVLACLARIHAIASMAATKLTRSCANTDGANLVEQTTPASTRDWQPQPLTPFPRQPSSLEGLGFPVGESLRTAALLDTVGGAPDTGPPGFPAPALPSLGVFESRIAEVALGMPSTKRVMVTDEAKGLASLAQNVVTSAQEEGPAASGIMGAAAKGSACEASGVSSVCIDAKLASMTVMNPVSQAAGKVDEIGRRKRAASWLEGLGLEASASTRGTRGTETTSQEHLTTGPERQWGSGWVQSNVTNSDNLASNLLAGTDFESFGGLMSGDLVRGKKRTKRRKASP